MPKLVFLNKEFAGKCHELADGKTTVGRGPENKLVLAHDSVSEHHAELLVGFLEVIVRDCGSTNGTYVNGVKAAHQLPARPGNVLRFGKVEARLELLPSEGLEDNTASDVTAIYAHRRHSRAPGEAPGAPVLPEHDLIQGEATRPSEATHTAIVPTGILPEASKSSGLSDISHSTPAAPAPRSKLGWVIIVILGAVLVGALLLWLRR